MCKISKITKTQYGLEKVCISFLQNMLRRIMYFCNMQENGVSEPLIRGHYKEIEKHAKHLRGAIAP